MARFRLTRNTFNTGVINKDIEQLEDFDMYNNALEECQNFIVNKTGGVYKRPGSLFAADITDLNIPPGRERIFTWYVDPNTRFWIIPSLENVYEMDIEGNPIKDDEGNPISTAYKNVKLNFYNTEGLVEGIKPFLLKHGGKYSTFGKFNFNYEENEYWKKNLEGKALTINITDFKIFHGISDCVFVDRSSYGEESFFFAVGPTYFHYPISVDELSINPMRFMFATAPARSNTKFTAHDVFLTNIQVYEPLMGTDFVKPGIRAVATNNDIIMMVGNAYQYSLHLDDSHYDCVYAYTTAGNKDGTPKYGVINIGPYYNVILYGIAYGAGKFVACGSDGSITGIILVCDVPTSLENWTPNWRVVWTHTTATYVWNKRIKYINGKFIILKQDDNILVEFSFLFVNDDPDNQSGWKNHVVEYLGVGSTTGVIFKLDVNDIVFFKGKYIAVGKEYNNNNSDKKYNVCNVYIADSLEEDFEQNTWKRIDVGTELELHSITIFHDIVDVHDKVIAVGDGGLMIESEDGVEWTYSTSHVENHTLGVVCSNYSSTHTNTAENLVYAFPKLDIPQSSAFSYHDYQLFAYLTSDLDSSLVGISEESEEAYIEGFKAIHTSSSSLIIFGEQTPPLELMYKNGAITSRQLNFDTPPMSFEDSSVTLYTNFTDFTHNYTKPRGVAPFVTPVKRTLTIEESPKLVENSIFRPWSDKTHTPPIIPTDDGIMVCLSYQVAGDTVKYEKWWFKTIGGARPPTSGWWFLHAKKKESFSIGNVVDGTDAIQRFCELEPIPERNPTGADGKPQALPWWKPAAIYIEGSEKTGEPGGKFDDYPATLCNLIAVPYSFFVSACSPRKGYFKAAAAHEQRLWLAATKEYPNGLWASYISSNSWLDFMTETAKGSAIQYKLDFPESNEICWLISKVKLYIGTKTGIYVVGAASFNDEMVTYDNIRGSEVSSKIGASKIPPVTLENSVLFVNGDLNNVSEITILENGVIKINTLTELSDEVLTPSITDNTATVIPYPIYWCSLADGSFAALTFRKQTNIMGWSWHTLGNAIPERASVRAMDGQLMDDSGGLLGMIVDREIYDETNEEHHIKKIRTLEYIRLNNSIKERRDEVQYYVDCGVEKEIVIEIDKISITPGNITYKFSQDDYTLLFKDSNFFAIYVNSLGANDVTNDFKSQYCYFKAGNYNQNGTPIRLVFGDKDYRMDVVTDSAFQAFFLKKADVSKVNDDSLEFTEHFDTDQHPSYKVRFFGTNTAIDYVNCELGDNVSGNTYKILDNNNKVINFKDLGITTIKLCFVGSFTNGKLLHPDLIGNNTVRSFVHTVTAGDLAVGDLVKIKSLTRMEELNDKQCQLAEVNTENNVILREVIGTVNNDKVTVALDTSLYDKSESVGLSGILYKYFKEVKGLDHLIGQQVDYLSDGNRGTEKITVKEDGTVTLPQETTYAAVGFAYKSILYTVPLSGGSMIGSSVGAIGRQNDCVISLYKSLGGKIGESSNETHDILYRRSDGKIVDVPHKLYTGMIRQSLAPSGNILERQVYIEHEDPTSFNVLSITQDVTVSDGAQ